MALLIPQLARRTRLGRARIGEAGRRAVFVAATLLGSAAFACAAEIASRNALWEVVRACAFDKTKTGSPWPCLEVDDAGGLARGFVILRPPVGRPDTILTPTRRIVGLEDPLLQRPDAPNYFALAWEARHWLSPAGAEPPPNDRVALAVNARLARSQDQLHIHLGCIAPDFVQSLSADGLGPATRTWFRGPDMGRGLELWSYRTGAPDLQAVAPFRLALQLLRDRAAMLRTTLAVLQVRGEFVVVALRSRPGGWRAEAEDIMEARC